jgi:hypothetical protein
VVERAIQSRELKRAIGRQNPKDLVLKVAGKEEYLLEEKSISCYQVSAMGQRLYAEHHEEVIGVMFRGHWSVCVMFRGHWSVCVMFRGHWSVL